MEVLRSSNLWDQILPEALFRQLNAADKQLTGSQENAENKLKAAKKKAKEAALKGKIRTDLIVVTMNPIMCLRIALDALFCQPFAFRDAWLTLCLPEGAISPIKDPNQNDPRCPDPWGHLRDRPRDPKRRTGPRPEPSPASGGDQKKNEISNADVSNIDFRERNLMLFVFKMMFFSFSER